MAGGLNPWGAVLGRWAAQIWGLAVHLVAGVLGRVALAPLVLPAPAWAVLRTSRTLALGAAGLALALALVRTVWPAGRAGGALTVVGRAVAGGLWMLLLPQVPAALLAVNNALVAALRPEGGLPAAVSAPTAVLTPALTLLLGIASAALAGYLAVFYAARAVEVVLLGALGPWMVLWWWAGGRPDGVGRWARELVAAVFVQSAHALLLRLLVLLWQAPGTAGSRPLFTAGVLWAMTQAPSLLRRSLGLGPGGTLPRW
ncbi:MAG: hypothetical protein OWV35_09975 [Firmicutes bacterium]|nr:hypothetical protein [Bacillota bacterium]